MTTKSITLDVWQSNDVRVKVNQGEIDSRFLQIKITDKNKAFDLADKTVIFYATKPDGNLIFNYCEIIDTQKGVVNLAMTSQMSIVPGIIRDCEIDIIDAGVTKPKAADQPIEKPEKEESSIEKLKVKGLSIEIVRCTDFDAAVESTSEFTALDEALADVQAVMDAYSEENIMKKIMSMDGEGSGLDADVLDGKHGKDYATAEQGKKADTALQGITGNGVEIPISADKIVDITPQDIGAVPTTRRINNKPLSSDITITPEIIGAAPVNHGNHIPAPQPASANVFLRNDNSWRPITPQDIGAATDEQGQKADNAIQGLRVNGVNLPPNTNQILDVETADLGAVPVTRKINNQTLDKDINITVTDLGAATKKQGEKADSALQGIKVNGETVPASSDGVVEITISDTSNAVLGIKGNGSMIPKDKNNVVNITPHIIGAVPVTRTINGYSLADDVTISMSDFGGATAEQGAKADSAIQGIRGNGSIISPDGNKIVSVTPAAIGAATSEQGSKADSAIQGVKVDGILLSPDNQNVVNVDTSVIDCATSEQGSKADSAIQGVKLNGTTITPDSQKVVNVQINETTVNTYTATIGTEWTTAETGEYSQTIEVSGILTTDNPIVDVVLDSEKELALSQLEAWGCVSKIETTNGCIAVTCFEDMPDVAIPIQLKVVR